MQTVGQYHDKALGELVHPYNHPEQAIAGAIRGLAYAVLALSAPELRSVETATMEGDRL